MSSARLLRLNVFSPLPPLPTEIANHTLAVLPELARRAQVRVWTTQDEVSALPEGVALVRYDAKRPEWDAVHDCDVNVYNLGNHAPFHRAIFDVARQAPGIVVLHDTRLQHFFGGYLTEPGDARALYMHLLAGEHGPAAIAHAERYLRGELPFAELVRRYPMTLAAIDRALAVVVHNEAELARIAGDASAPLVHIPLSAAFGPVPERASRDGRTIHLVMCGFIGGNRRLPSVLRAIAATGDPDLHLDVFGTLEEPEPIRRLVGQLRLTGQVTLHGFVPPPVLDAALARADLAINLRYPSMGEASASQLRMWAFALPTLVTRTGWYAALPHDVVLHVDMAHEVESVAAYLRALRRDPRRFAAAGQRGRARLERDHTPSAYADRLVALAARHQALHLRLHATGLAQTVARRATEFASGIAAHRMASRFARAIAGLTTPPHA